MSTLAPTMEGFFTERLIGQRRASPHTVASYRDTFRLLLRYLKRTNPGRCYSLSLDVLTPDTVLRFLEHLEQQRGNCVRTRNARLAAIRNGQQDHIRPSLTSTDL